MSSDRTRHILLIALLLLVLPFAAACGGAAEEPAPEAPAEEPAPAPVEESMLVEPPAEDVADDTPQEPQIVGNIILSNDAFDWGEVTDGTQAYTWTARVQNDTTSTLDITVIFQFLDESDEVIKTETATVRVPPASGRTISRSGTMSYGDEAMKVVSFLADYDYTIVS